MSSKARLTAIAFAAASYLFCGYANAAGWTERASITAVQVWKTGTWVQIADAASNPNTCASQAAGWYRLDSDTASRPLLAKVMQAQSMASQVRFYSDSCVGDYNAVSGISD